MPVVRRSEGRATEAGLAAQHLLEAVPPVIKWPQMLLAMACLSAPLPAVAQGVSTNAFLNFETAPIHPIAMSGDGQVLAACNLPDGRVELFAPSGDALVPLASVPVGIDPVSVRFRTTNELWVVNAISDSINVIDVARRTVAQVIETKDAPADVIFTQGPDRAFISCAGENLVMVLDLATKGVSTIPLPGERPKAMAISPDGSSVYVAMFESGNGTTILAPRFTGLLRRPPAGPIDLETGPYGGQNPPPNAGDHFVPALNTNLPASSQPPRTSLIVKRTTEGRWRDDNQHDCTEFVSGTNAAFSGRVEGWDLLDHDVAVIDTKSLAVSYIDRLMNICASLAVNSRDGVLAVVGTEAMNHLRFEEVLQSVFVRGRLALVSQPEGRAAIHELNPHLTYAQRSVSASERAKSLGDSRAALWDLSGTRLFVTGMGSGNLAVFDASGARAGSPIALPDGPTGLALDPSGKFLYVLNRFAASVSILDATSLEVKRTVDFFDPTPEIIRRGRRHFYDTHKTSGLGQASCASCHLDGRMDRLAWDLGAPTGKIKALSPAKHNFGSIPPSVTNHFHPMKGPMVTQTLQDIVGHEPFHWRGDRDGIEEFNPTFEELQGADNELTDVEMKEFEGFLATMHFPPNRFRNFDNSLSRDVPLSRQSALGRGDHLFKGDGFRAGDATVGLTFFRSITAGCQRCHTIPSGLGPDRRFANTWQPVPAGPNGERHVALAAIERSHDLPFKIPHLRNLADRVGLDYLQPSTSGFGFLHDGGVDTLTRFLQDGFDLTDDQDTADAIAFLLSFSGSDLPKPPGLGDVNNAPGDFSRDTPAALGKQRLIVGAETDLSVFLARANAATGRVDLIVKGVSAGQARGWLWNSSLRLFQSDHAGERLSSADLFTQANADGPLLAMLVPSGLGVRLGIDRDLDGTLDFDESQLLATASHGSASLTIVRLGQQTVEISWLSAANRRHRLLNADNLYAGLWRVVDIKPVAAHGRMTLRWNPAASERAQYFRLEPVEEDSP
jgi:DNA-binding beta-propeller fold protein YncE